MKYESAVNHVQPSARSTCVEALEHRAYLSANPTDFAALIPSVASAPAGTAVVMTLDVGKQNATPQFARPLKVTKPKPVIPILTGAPFTGTAVATDGNVGVISLTITSETKKGVCKGSMQVRVSLISDTLTATGTVNAKGKSVLHFKSSRATLTATGTASATVMSGKFTFKYSFFGHHGSSHGTYKFTRTA